MKNLARKIYSIACFLILVLFFSGCSGSPKKQVSSESEDSHTRELSEAIQLVMSKSRQSIDEFGVTEQGMLHIKSALEQLAKEPGLTSQKVKEIHGGGVASTILASDGDDDITLILARFDGGVTTPIHDHSAWAVALLVEGRERYTHWERRDDGTDPNKADLQVKYEKILRPGDYVYWFDPPHDIHSQEALDGTAWELLLFGKNPLRGVNLHYFDPETGVVTARKPQ